MKLVPEVRTGAPGLHHFHFFPPDSLAMAELKKDLGAVTWEHSLAGTASCPAEGQKPHRPWERTGKSLLASASDLPAGLWPEGTRSWGSDVVGSVTALAWKLFCGIPLGESSSLNSSQFLAGITISRVLRASMLQRELRPHTKLFMYQVADLFRFPVHCRIPRTQKMLWT